jgi:hypothetical protein
MSSYYQLENISLDKFFITVKMLLTVGNHPALYFHTSISPNLAFASR